MSAGGLATMVAGLERSQAVRIATVSMLQHIMYLQPVAKVTADLTLLARMNVVRRLSRLLCPDFASVDEDEYSLGMQELWLVTHLSDHTLHDIIDVTNDCWLA